MRGKGLEAFRLRTQTVQTRTLGHSLKGCARIVDLVFDFAGRGTDRVAGAVGAWTHSHEAAETAPTKAMSALRIAETDPSRNQMQGPALPDQVVGGCGCLDLMPPHTW